MKNFKSKLTTSMLFALLAIVSNTGLAACITTSGTYTVNSNSVDCYTWSAGDITINSGASVTPLDLSSPIVTSGAVGTLLNNGSIISNNVGGGGEPVRIENNVTMISNGSTGIIQNQTSAFTVFVLNGTVSTLNNSGQIRNIGNNGAAEAAIGVAYGSGVITNLNNLAGGSISTVDHSAIVATYGGRIANITNAGDISVTGVVGDYWGINDNGSVIFNDAHMTSITNTGSIYTAVSGAFGIMNNVSNVNDTNTGVIDTLNNLQGAGNTHGALTYSGRLPSNYNIIINSPTSFGKLAVTSGTGTTTFGIYTGSTVANGTYAAVISGITSSNLTATSGTYGSGSWLLSNSSGTIWDLILSGYTPAGPSATDTQSALNALTSKLRGAFSSQAIATNFANMNTYDCNLFDNKGLCISVGGQQTYVDNPSSSNMTSAVVVTGYKVSPTLRIGGFLNQNLNNHTSASVVISNDNPLMGLFAVWNQNEDHLGYQVKIANAYQDKDVTTLREVTGTSEAGRGNTELNTRSYVGEVSYAFLANEDKTLVRPYAAVRYTRIKQDAYTEETTSAVTAPLTYAALSDRSTAALVGIKIDHKLAEKLNLKASLGVEQDLSHQVDNLTATGVSGLSSENFNDNIKRTRPVASIGAYYMPAKNQRIAADLYYQQLPFQSTGSTTAYINYMIGL